MKKSVNIYAGTQDYVDFFETVMQALEIDLDYDVYECDGELEIEVRGGKIGCLK